MIWVPVIVVLVIALLTLVPRWLEGRRARIDARERQGAAGQFAELSQGTTHFQWHGSGRGKVIVAIHGLTTPSIVWDTVAPGLIAMGYRVLSYDLYGRGLSDAPTGPQDRHFFLQQLRDLLKHQGIDQDVTLLGYSMGGSIAVAFAQEQPHRVAQILLVAPAGIQTNESGFSKWCRQTPYLGDWLHGVVASRRMKRAISKTSQPAKIADVLAQQATQLDRQGYLLSVLSSRRGMLNEQQEEAHRLFAARNIPVAAVWGGADQVVPVTALGMLASWNRQARQDVIDGADHGLPYTHGLEVADDFRDLLKVP